MLIILEWDEINNLNALRNKAWCNVQTLDTYKYPNL